MRRVNWEILFRKGEDLPRIESELLDNDKPITVLDVTDPVEEVGDAADEAGDCIEIGEVKFEGVVKGRDVEDPDLGAVPETDVVKFANTELEEVVGPVPGPVDVVEFWFAETEVEELVEFLVPSAVPERADDEEFPPSTLNRAVPVAERRISRATLRRLSR